MPRPVYALRVEDAPGLSQAATRFVQDHPQEAHAAVAIALEEAAGEGCRKRPQGVESPRPVYALHADDAPGLFQTATQFAHDPPQDAHAAVATALEEAAVEHETGGEPCEVPEHLKRFVVVRPYGPEMLDVSQAAALLEVSRATVYDWSGKKIRSGWKSARQPGVVIPAEPILGPGRVVPGIREVLEIIGHPGLAWDFLTQEWSLETEVMRPIDKLKAGEVREVLASAPGFGTDFT